MKAESVGRFYFKSRQEVTRHGITAADCGKKREVASLLQVNTKEAY